MWNLHALATATHQRPSDIVGIDDRWAAYQFDAATCLVGTTVENALQETYETGGKLTPRYTLTQLLDAGFRLPPPAGSGSAVKALKKMAAKDKAVRYHKVK